MKRKMDDLKLVSIKDREDKEETRKVEDFSNIQKSVSTMERSLDLD